ILDDREVLINHAHTERTCLARVPGDKACAVDADDACVWTVITHDAFYEGALAHSVLSEQGVDGTRCHFHRNVVEGDERAERLADAGKVERGHRRHRVRFGLVELRQRIHGNTLRKELESATAPNTPFCMVTIFSAAW